MGSEPNRKPGVSPRFMGVFAIFGSLFFFFLGVWKPISDAMNHEPQVSLWMKAAGIAPLTLGLGIIFAILGDNYPRIFGTNTRPSKLGPAIFVILMVLGYLLYVWVKQFVASYGYISR